MLDFMRKHAASWKLKVVLGAIIVSFIFFFGYSQMRSGGPGSKGAPVAKVNGNAIPGAEFEFFYGNTLERIRQSFKGVDQPDFIKKMALQTTMRQMIQRELILEQAEKLGLVIPDVELAEAIKKSQTIQQGGEFDPIFYRNQFLKRFKSRFGIDYEEFVRQDMKIGAYETIYRDVDETPILAPGENEWTANVTWTFDVVEIDKPNDETLAKAKELIDTPQSKWKGKLKKLGLEAKEIGPIKISERRRLIGGKGELEDYEEIFTLTEEKPVLKRPLQRGGKVYVVRMKERVEKTDDVPSRNLLSPFFIAWMGKLQQKAKIESFLQQE